MLHGSLATWDNAEAAWDRADENTPLPICALGEGTDAASEASANAYALIAASKVDTETNGHANIAMQCVVDTADVVLKAVASIDGTKWYDLPNLADESGVNRSGMGAVIEITTSLGEDVTVAVVFLIPEGDALSCFRYFGIEHKSAVADTPGNTQVSVFTK